jgi:hypothetical protein
VLLFVAAVGDFTDGFKQSSQPHINHNPKTTISAKKKSFISSG